MMYLKHAAYVCQKIINVKIAIIWKIMYVKYILTLFRVKIIYELRAEDSKEKIINCSSYKNWNTLVILTYYV